MFQGQHIVFADEEVTPVNPHEYADFVEEEAVTPEHQQEDTEETQCLEEAEQSVLGPFGSSNAKYWAQRYCLFSRFDDGIILPDRGSLPTLFLHLPFYTSVCVCVCVCVPSCRCVRE